MIVIDTSALVAILNHEPECSALLARLRRQIGGLLSAVSYHEAGHVLCATRGVKGLYDLKDLPALIKAEIIPRDVELAAPAVEAFRRCGKGIDPKAQLNFCDCTASAPVKAMRAPLLFKGGDFRRSDLQSAV